MEKRRGTLWTGNSRTLSIERKGFIHLLTGQTILWSSIFHRDLVPKSVFTHVECGENHPLKPFQYTVHRLCACAMVLLFPRLTAASNSHGLDSAASVAKPRMKKTLHPSTYAAICKGCCACQRGIWCKGPPGAGSEGCDHERSHGRPRAEPCLYHHTAQRPRLCLCSCTWNTLSISEASGISNVALISPRVLKMFWGWHRGVAC